MFREYKNMYLIIFAVIVPFIGIVYYQKQKIKKKLSKELFESLVWPPLSNPQFKIQEFLEQKADPNFFYENRPEKNTPLCDAAYHHQTNNIKLLLQYKADINKSDKLNKTPLIYSLSHYEDDLDEINMLLEKKANTNHADYKGDTAFIHVLKEGQTSNDFTLTILKQLLKYNANPLHTNFKNKSALTIAKQLKYEPPIIEFLTTIEQQEKEKQFQAIKRIIFCSLFAKATHRKNEHFKKLSEMELFDRNVIERGILPFLK